MTGVIRVLIADDQLVIQQGLSLVLGLLPGVEVVGTASDGNEALALTADTTPDIVLMDLRMPRCDGVEATRRIRQHHPAVKVLVLTTFSDQQSVLEALRAGACGYLTKDASGDEIGISLHQVMTDGAAVQSAVLRHLVDAIAGSPAGPESSYEDAALPPGAADVPAGGPLTAALTPREAEVLKLMTAGLSNAEISCRLVISEATVKSHVSRMLGKIGARNRAQAIVYAYQHGLTSPS